VKGEIEPSFTLHRVIWSEVISTDGQWETWKGVFCKTVDRTAWKKWTVQCASHHRD